jgi:hypothetical protein
MKVGVQVGYGKANTPGRACVQAYFEPARARLRPGVIWSLYGLELAGDGIECGAQVRTDSLHDGHGGDGDECGDETVFDRGCSVIILQQLRENLKHWFLRWADDAVLSWAGLIIVNAQQHCFSFD